MHPVFQASAKAIYIFFVQAEFQKFIFLHLGPVVKGWIAIYPLDKWLFSELHVLKKKQKKTTLSTGLLFIRWLALSFL